MISGSFPLQTSSNQQNICPTSDIDIYLEKGNYKGVNIMNKYLKDAGYSLVHSKTYKDLRALHKKEGKTYKTDNYKILGGVMISQVDSFENNNKRQIQVIQSRNKKITSDKIIGGFDLSICKNKMYCRRTKNNGDENNITYNIRNKTICIKPFFQLKHGRDVIFKVLRINPDIKRSFISVLSRHPINVQLSDIDV